ncbi:type II toxin-antitoxin system RelE/ParE family toxin [Cohnella cellulosilytica]|uniref:Type II toxin-antitoxin system RelE/ParE family toxin n=1 Tax=Cohnella cellulosilytica TaxID=986710 RepID=A0ABW2FB56_9BACL
MRFRVVITEPAESDLRGIANYISHELLEPVTARTVVANISEAVLLLETMPYRHELVRDQRLAGQHIRKVLVDSYIVFYVISEQEKTVTIVRILYGKRHWSSIL